MIKKTSGQQHTIRLLLCVFFYIHQNFNPSAMHAFDKRAFRRGRRSTNTNFKLINICFRTQMQSYIILDTWLPYTDTLVLSFLQPSKPLKIHFKFFHFDIAIQNIPEIRNKSFDSYFILWKWEWNDL